jgi:hypothetical protein
MLYLIKHDIVPAFSLPALPFQRITLTPFQQPNQVHPILGFSGTPEPNGHYFSNPIRQTIQSA